MEEAIASVVNEGEEAYISRCKGETIGPKMVTCNIQLKIFLEDETIGVSFDES